MPTTIKLKNSVTTTSVPSSLVQGEVAINITDKKVWVGNAATTPIQLLGGGADGNFTNISVSSVATFGAGTVSAPSITTTGDTNTGMFFPAADTIAFTEGGVESMRIDSSGNVGIGTTSPSGKLGIAFDNATIRIGQANSTDRNINIRANTGYNASMTFTEEAVSDRWTIGTKSGSNGFIFATGSTLALGTELMRIDSSGNLAIGLSAASTKLDVNGIGRFRRAIETTQYTEIDTGGGLSNITAVNGASSTFQSIAFNSGNNASTTERMRIDSSGNVGIGTTSQFASSSLTLQKDQNASTRLSIKNDTNGSSTGAAVVLNAFGNSWVVECGGISKNSNALTFAIDATASPPSEKMRIDSSGIVRINNTSNATYSAQLNTQFTSSLNCGLYLKVTNTSSSQSMIIFGNTNNDAVGAINTSGSSTSYVTSSDYRLKENIAPMTGALAKVQALKPCTYTWKLDGSSGQGFIAHELQAIVPECVTGEKDALNKQGKPEYQGIDTSFLVATLTAAIQELNAKVEAQAVRIAELESK